MSASPHVAGALLGVALLASAGCGSDAPGDAYAASDEPLLVLAASNLTAALEAAVSVYRAATGEEVTVVFGASGNLAAQIRNGAPADVYVSADEAFLDGLVTDGRMIPATRREIAVGRLALVVPQGRTPPDDLRRLIDPGFEVVALANPEHAPYGMAGRAALRALGVWEDVRPRLVLAENVAQALQYVRTGNADAGLVALSLVLTDDQTPGPRLPYVMVDPGLHPPLLQVGGVVAATRHPRRASAFLAWITGPEGREILSRYGFEAPTS